MIHNPQRISTFLVIAVLVAQVSAEWRTGTAELASGQLGMAHLLLLEAIALGFALLLLLGDWRRPEVDADVERERALRDAEARSRWEAEMEPYFRRAAEVEVRAASSRQEKDRARAAAAERDQGKYGVRKLGSSSTIPTAVDPGSEPSSS